MVSAELTASTSVCILAAAPAESLPTVTVVLHRLGLRHGTDTPVIRSAKVLLPDVAVWPPPRSRVAS